MAVNFDSAEFIEIVDELMQDGAPGVVQLLAGATYDPTTLTFVDVGPTNTNCRVVFVAPSESNLTDYEIEDKDINSTEKKWAIISYRGELPSDASLSVLGKVYLIRALIDVNPLGQTLYHRVKLYR